jgi:hypothetical protein
MQPVERIKAATTERDVDRAAMVEMPSVDEWILATLQERGAQPLDRLAASLPEVNWAQFFLAIDRLSRGGKISLWRPSRADYVVSLTRAA